MAGALARRSAPSSRRAGATNGGVSRAPRHRFGRRRTRAHFGKSKDPTYKPGSAYVMESVHDEVMAGLMRPEVKALLLRQLLRFGVRHAPKKDAYSGLVELLLRRWLEGLEEVQREA